MSLTITAVICTRNRPIDLERTLTSIGWQTRRADAVIVVDDSDPERRDETTAVCEAADDEVTLLRKDVPGLTASRNLSLEHVETDLLVYFDDDIVLRPDYLEVVVGAFEDDPGLAGAGGSIDDDHDYELPWVRALLGIPGRKTGRVYGSGWSTQLPQGRSGPVEHLIGCNMAYRTEILREYGFNTDFQGYALGEDLEVSFRMHRDGHRLRVLGDARIWHLTALPRHDRSWGYREIVIRPVVAGGRFNRARFLVAAGTMLLTNRVKNPERAKGNLEGIKAVLGGSADDHAQVGEKVTR